MMQHPIFKIAICLLLTLTLCHGGNSKNIDIVRGARDRFTNLVGCSEPNAVCFNISCTYCQCMVDHTYVYTEGRYGKCILNEMMVYVTSNEDSFPLQLPDFFKLCVYQHPYNQETRVSGSTTCSYDKLDYRWIWTNFGQLLNWQTLECMTDDYNEPSNGKYYVTMKKCDRNNRRQLWECVGDRIKQTQSGRYMYHGERYGYVTTKNIFWFFASKWTRVGSENDVCSQAVGCETFADGSSLLILDRTKCEEQSECLGEKEISLTETKCFLLLNKTQYLHNDTWKALETKNGSFAITVDKVSVQWNLDRTPKSWKGLIVKVQFQCESKATQHTTIEHCVVIKYMGTFTGFNYSEEDAKSDKNIPPNRDPNDVKKHSNTNNNKTKNGIDLHNDQGSNSAGKNNTQIIIIIVCALVFFCIAGVIGIIVYKRRCRPVRSKNHNAENPVTDPDSSPVVQELAEYANSSKSNSQPGPRQPQRIYTTPKQEHEYEYVCANDRTFGLQSGSHKYEIPQCTKYENPEQPQNDQYEYPSIGELQLKNGKSENVNEKRNNKASKTEKTGVGAAIDGECTALVRPPLNSNENDDGGYAHLNNVRRGKVGGTERKDKPDGLLNAMHGEYTPLVRPSLKNECEDSSYTPLINSKRKSEQAGGGAREDEEDEYLYASAMDGEYTQLARPPLKSEAPSYTPLIKK